MRRQIAERRADAFDPLANAVAVMTAQVVHDDEVARPQRGDQDLVEVGEKTFAIHRPVQEAGCTVAG